MITVVNLESSDYSPEAARILESVSDLRLCSVGTGDEARRCIRDAHVVISRLAFRLDAALLEAAPDLRMVATATTGTDHVDEKYLDNRGVAFICLRGERAFLDTIYATAEHTMALILSLLRRIPAAHRSVVDDGTWNRMHFRGTELAGKTVGIIGCGRVGSRVATYCRAFGCNVMVTDIHDVRVPDGAVRCSRDELLAASDIVSLHIDLTPENYHFMSTELFSRMKQGALFINTSRGDCVDSAALRHALEAGHIGGAALDVLDGEIAGRVSDSPLRKCAAGTDTCIITPHIGGATIESMHATEVFIARKIAEHLEAF